MILHRYFQTPEGMMNLFDEMLGHAFEEKVFVGGRMNLLDFGIKQDIEQLKSVYSFMQNSDELTHLLNGSATTENPIVSYRLRNWQQSLRRYEHDHCYV